MDPPVSSWIGTNYVPSDAEVEEIKGIIHEPLKKLSKLEANINVTALALEKLQLERATLKSSIDDYRSLISPCRRLPEDIMQEVFLACLPGSRNPTMSSDEAPMLLTHICASWRRLALATPRLWSAIHIPVPSAQLAYGHMANNDEYDITAGPIVQRRAEVVAEWLGRSGSCPISISLHEWNGYPANQYCVKMVDVVLPFSDRWKDVSFVTSSMALSKIAQLSPAELPMLESLSLNFSRSPPATPGQRWTSNDFLSAERLHTLVLSSFDQDIPSLPIRWQNLTSLTLEGNEWGSTMNPSPVMVKAILKLCTQLRRCAARIIPNSEFEFDNPDQLLGEEVITLPFLTSFTLHDESHRHSLLPFVKVPALRVLGYTVHAIAESSSSALISFLQKQEIPLEELSVNCRSFTSDDLLTCLKACPALKVLKVKPSRHAPPIPYHYDNISKPVNDALLLRLAPLDDSAIETICPKLEDVEFAADVNISEDALLDFILRKQKPPGSSLSSLKRIFVVFGRNKTRDISSSLTEQISDGLKVHTAYPPPMLRGPFSLYDGIANHGHAHPFYFPPTFP